MYGFASGRFPLQRSQKRPPRWSKKWNFLWKRSSKCKKSWIKNQKMQNHWKSIRFRGCKGGVHGGVQEPLNTVEYHRKSEDFSESAPRAHLGESFTKNSPPPYNPPLCIIIWYYLIILIIFDIIWSFWLFDVSFDVSWLFDDEGWRIKDQGYMFWWMLKPGASGRQNLG